MHAVFLGAFVLSAMQLHLNSVWELHLQLHEHRVDHEWSTDYVHWKFHAIGQSLVCCLPKSNSAGSRKPLCCQACVHLANQAGSVVQHHLKPTASPTAPLSAAGSSSNRVSDNFAKVLQVLPPVTVPPLVVLNHRKASGRGPPAMGAGPY